MSGGFRDTFTKDQQKDELLGYDDTAFYYFASTVLLCVAVPWTYSVIHSLIFPDKAQVEKHFPAKSKTGSRFRYCETSEMHEKIAKARSDARSCSGGPLMWWMLKGTSIVLMWGALVGILSLVGNEKKDIKSFDPFDILEVGHSASNAEIKKAYRKLSLVYHPDKNPDDPLASSRFIQITKAYAALTDEQAKANWEKYGNPDGPQTSKVGIGLPRFMLEKENHLMMLCVFFFFLLFVVPMTFICYYQRTKDYAANGVMLETLQILGQKVTESTRSKNCPELLAASAESRSMLPRPTDNAQMKPLSQLVIEHKKRQFSMPIIVKNQYLIWAHMQRLHQHMSPELRTDCDQLLRYSVKITQAMIEIAGMREWFFTAQAMIEFRRCLVQALDVKCSTLLQIPHFDEETLKHCHKGKNSISSLTDFITKDPEQRKGLAKMQPHQIADIEAFCRHVSDLEVRAIIECEDEKEICVGDIATVTVQLIRKNLKSGEAMGPVHAPLFPEPKMEEWWLFLVEGTTATRIISFERITSPEREIQEKMRFQISRPGKHSLTLHVLCDSYAGLDHKVDLNFVAQHEEEVKREIIVHPEDEDLDLQPTLFQQFMGDFGQEEESEEEEEDDKKKQKVIKDVKDVKGDDTYKRGADDDSDDGEDEKKEKGADDTSDSSSSDSD